MTPKDDALDIVGRLKNACIGAPYAKIPWPHRLLHDAISEIEQLRAALAHPPVDVEVLKRECEEYLGDNMIAGEPVINCASILIDYLVSKGYLK